MAKKQSDELGKPDQEKGREKPRPVGVYLTVDQKNMIGKIAQENGFAAHAILKYAIVKFLEDYQAGKIKIETETRTFPKIS